MTLKLMCVVAHPDDECFAFGGALALASRSRVETSVICFTDGQAAKNRGESASAEHLGQIRRQEFAESCEVLGVTEHELLDYADARLEFADFSKAASLLVQRIRSNKPDVVITFGLDGGLNTHPDHTMVSSFTNAAFHWAASAKRFPEHGPIHAPARLFLLASSFFLPDRPAPLPCPWTLTLDVREVMEQRHLAFCKHTSQAPLMEKTRALFAEHGKTEHYSLAATHQAGPAVLSDSMFAGL